MGMLVDGFDVETIGVKVRDGVGGWKDALRDTVKNTNLPRKPGGRLYSQERETGSREIDLPLYLEGSTKIEARSRLDELKFRMSANDILVQLPDEDREFTARLKTLTTEGVQSDFNTIAFDLSAQLFLEDPRLYETATTSVDFSDGTATDVQLGTAVTHPTITVEEVTAPYEIQLLDENSNLVVSLELGTSLAAGEQRIIDMAKHTIEDANGNNKISEKSSGRFFGLDPHQGSYGGPWPKLKITNTATTATADYQKAYI